MTTDPVYLDHNASTPLDSRVLEAMHPHFLEFPGNPSSVDHWHGHRAAQAVEQARETVAKAIGAKPRDIIFTSGCTEANNLVILGLALRSEAPGHIVTTQIEHPAILEPCRVLEDQGWSVSRVPVDETGTVDPTDIDRAIRSDTVLVTVMGANNEVGSCQPLDEIGKICASKGVTFHSDLAQLAGNGPVNVEALNLSVASFSAHKVYGPKGVGAVYLRSGSRVRPLHWGGGQERGLRPGTLNTPAIVGMAEAFRLMRAEGLADHRRISELRDRLWDALSTIDGIERNGSGNRLANNLSVSIEGVEPLALMRRVRQQVSLSSSSACATGKVETSHVLLAMFGDGPRARRALRISPGRFTTEQEIDEAAGAIVEAVGALRRLAA